MTPAERAAAVAEQARAQQPKPLPDEGRVIARERWIVHKAEGPQDLFCWPPFTQREVQALYKGCRIEAVIS